jgi:hypothetical protein
MIRNDASQSILVAFTVGELRGPAQAAGLDKSQVNRHHLFFRMVLAGRK